MEVKMKAIVPLADGVEEMEAVTILDVLRRAGWDVTAAALKRTEVVGAHGIRLLADALWKDINTADYGIIVLPGGMGGVEAMLACPTLLDTLKAFVDKGKPLAAICAAPLVLHAAGLLKGKKVTAYPSLLERLVQASRSNERVVADGLIVTSRGPGTALEFALALVERFGNPAKAAELARAMLLAPANDNC